MDVGLLTLTPYVGVSPFSGFPQRKSFHLGLQIVAWGQRAGLSYDAVLEGRSVLSREVQQTSGYEGTGGPPWGFRGLT